METSTTNDIKVSVQTFYLVRESRPKMQHYAHAYRITIENMGSEKVQLLRRHWYIWDSNNSLREVEGEGVVGEQPTLAPGESFEYTSWCPLSTEVGKMYGTFLMQRAKDRSEFKVDVPEFKLIAPGKSN